MTIYRATRELVLEGYLVPRPGIGLFVNPARREGILESASRRLIGIIAGEGAATQYERYTWQRLTAIGNCIVESGYRLKQIYLENLLPDAAAAHVGGMGLSGVIWIHPGRQGVETIQRLISTELPIVVVDRHVSGVPCVCRDEYREGYEMGQRLLEHGRRHPVVASLLSSEQTSPPLEGLRAAWQEAGLAPEALHILHEPSMEMERLTELFESGASVDAIWLTGIIGFSILPQILSLLRKHRLSIPSDCTLIAGQYPSPVPGFCGYVRRHPYEKQAELVWQELTQSIEQERNEPEPRSIVFPLEYIEESDEE